MNSENKLKALCDIMESMVKVGNIIDPKFGKELNDEFDNFKESISHLEEGKQNYEAYQNTEGKTDWEIRLAIYLDMDKSILTPQSIEERVDKIFKYIKTGEITKYSV